MPNSTPRVRFLFIKSIVSTQFYVDVVIDEKVDAVRNVKVDSIICIL
ncbi:hypothetical protein BOVA711_683 [Bacteroides ovatus]|nr:hypothetical protein BOVA711_683 [Bacteroides ovatus]